MVNNWQLLLRDQRIRVSELKQQQKQEVEKLSVASTNTIFALKTKHQQQMNDMMADIRREKDRYRREAILKKRGHWSAFSVEFKPSTLDLMPLPKIPAHRQAECEWRSKNPLPLPTPRNMSDAKSITLARNATIRRQQQLQKLNDMRNKLKRSNNLSKKDVSKLITKKCAKINDKK